MKNSYLFPSYFKKIGWIMLPFFLVFSICVLDESDYEWRVKVFALLDDGWGAKSEWFKFGYQNIINELAFLGLTLSLLFIAFAKQKQEDEYISRIRHDSLIWAVITGYIILTVATLSIYGSVYFQVMIYNMFLILILFIIKFNLALYKLKKSAGNEE